MVKAQKSAQLPVIPAITVNCVSTRFLKKRKKEKKEKSKIVKTVCFEKIGEGKMRYNTHPMQRAMQKHIKSPYQGIRGRYVYKTFNNNPRR